MADKSIIARFKEFLAPNKPTPEAVVDDRRDWAFVALEASIANKPELLVEHARATKTAPPLDGSDLHFLQQILENDTAFFQHLRESGLLAQPTQQEMYKNNVKTPFPRKGLEHLAAERGRTDVIQMLGELGWDLERPGKYSHSLAPPQLPITVAAQHGHLDTMRALFIKTQRTDLDDDKLLIAAAKSGNPDVFQEARSYSCDESQKVLNSALAAALRAGHWQSGQPFVALIDKVLEAGANIDAPADVELSDAKALPIAPLSWALNKPQHLQILLERGADPFVKIRYVEGFEAYNMSIMDSTMAPESIELLHAYGEQHQCSDAMKKELRHNVQSAVRYLLEHAYPDTAENGPKLVALLDNAQRFDLISSGVARDLFQDQDTARALFQQAGERGDVWQKKMDAEQAINRVLGAKDAQSLDTALQAYTQNPELVTTPNLTNDTAMPCLAQAGVTAIDAMRSLGADVHAKDSWGLNAVHHAARALDTQAIRHLHALGVDVNARDKEGFMAGNHAINHMRTWFTQANPLRYEQTLSTLETLATLNSNITDRKNPRKTSALEDMETGRMLKDHREAAQKTYGGIEERFQRLRDTQSLQKQEAIRARLREELAARPAPKHTKAPPHRKQEDAIET